MNLLKYVHDKNNRIIIFPNGLKPLRRHLSRRRWEIVWWRGWPAVGGWKVAWTSSWWRRSSKMRRRPPSRWWWTSSIRRRPHGARRRRNKHRPDPRPSLCLGVNIKDNPRHVIHFFFPSFWQWRDGWMIRTKGF